MNCDKTFSCCLDLHDNTIHCGGSERRLCPFHFRDKMCKAERDPTVRELSLYRKLTSQRRLVAHLEEKIGDLETNLRG